MDWKTLTQYRLQICGLAVVIILGFWFTGSYRPRAAAARTLEERQASLDNERTTLLQRIADEQQQLAAASRLPSRIVSAPTGQLTPIERLNYFLENITRPANELALGYFTVTPHSPVSGPDFQEVPFTISVAGGYAALADYLYQLEYGQDFVVRDVALARGEGDSVRADFRLSALLLNDPSRALPADSQQADPGRPTSLELARDPFTQPPARLAIGEDGKPYFLNVPAGLRLTGVMRMGGHMAAIINHEPYRIGSVIDNKTITKIDERGVELTDKVRTYFLEMERPTTASVARNQEASRR